MGLLLFIIGINVGIVVGLVIRFLWFLKKIGEL